MTLTAAAGANWSAANGGRNLFEINANLPAGTALNKFPVGGTITGYCGNGTLAGNSCPGATISGHSTVTMSAPATGTHVAESLGSLPVAYTGGTGANQTSFEAQAGNYWYGSGLLYNQSGTASLLNQVPTLTFTIGGDTVVFHTEGDATVVATNGDAGFELWGYSVDTTSGTYTNGNPAVCVAGLTQTTAQGKCPSFLVAMLGVDASPSGTQANHVTAADSTVGTVGSVQTLTASNSAWRYLQPLGAVTGGGAQAGTTISSTTGFGDVGSTLHLSLPIKPTLSADEWSFFKDISSIALAYTTTATTHIASATIDPSSCIKAGGAGNTLCIGGGTFQQVSPTTLATANTAIGSFYQN